ncbi:hypothetical protein [Streptomyces flavofungini]|uniref:hypothetical protein n=1 Tax=Streptomyces flavofungini TaxID=68200 RepID=UPI0025B17A4E|nr:hypothetical protein [Streptomyces flavofungini]WJV48628.1 hypothetical protein QUY26_25810 [Streptomyces flavofungini]
MPQAVRADVAALRGEVIRTLGVLRDTGVAVRTPWTVHDTLASGRSGTRSNDTEWWLPLAKSTRPEAVRLGVALKSVRFPCSRTDEVSSRSAGLWAATVAAADRRYLAWQRQEEQQLDNPGEVMAAMKRRVAAARELPKERQAARYASELVRACADTDQHTPS